MTTHRSDWPELFGMARTKESAPRYQTTLSAAILSAEVVGWERDYVGPKLAGLLRNGLLNICTNHLFRPFSIANGCLWLISCLKVFEIVVCYGEVKPGRLCRTRTVVLRGALRQFTCLRDRIKYLQIAIVTFG